MPQTMSQQRTSAAAAPMNTFGMPQSTAPMIPPQQQQQQPTGPVSCSFDTGHTGSIHDAQLDYYGKRLATASGDSTVRVWDVSEYLVYWTSTWCGVFSREGVGSIQLTYIFPSKNAYRCRY